MNKDDNDLFESLFREAVDKSGRSGDESSELGALSSESDKEANQDLLTPDALSPNAQPSEEEVSAPPEQTKDREIEDSEPPETNSEFRIPNSEFSSAVPKKLGGHGPLRD